MPKIWVGYSKTLNFEELISEYLDPYFAPISLDEDDIPVGRIELEFGASRIGPGDFEVYENKHDNSANFDFYHLLKLFPFPDPPSGLSKIDFSAVKCVFFVKSDNLPQKLEDDNVTITDSLEVKFDWE